MRYQRTLNFRNKILLSSLYLQEKDNRLYDFAMLEHGLHVTCSLVVIFLMNSKEEVSKSSELTRIKKIRRNRIQSHLPAENRFLMYSYSYDVSLDPFHERSFFLLLPRCFFY